MDSPSGGPSKLGRLLGQPFGRTLETAPRAKGRNNDLSTELHTYGVIYPAGLHRPELVPTGTQTAFRLYETISLGGREKPDKSNGMCMRARMSFGQPPPLLFIGKPRGKVGIE